MKSAKATLLRATSCLTHVSLIALACAMPTHRAMANPKGGVVTGGIATITESGAKLDVNQMSERAVIDWRSFNVDADEHTQFHQPSSSSITLNRVNDASPSFINGKVTANGNVIIMNQNGVVFGNNSRVDVNGIVATTADIDTGKFMSGSLSFDKPGKPDAVIVNEGMISAKEAGLVGLVAPQVVNSGIILAKAGRVHLASGDTATVDFYGDGLMEVAVKGDIGKQMVSHTGTIDAAGGKIALTAAAGVKIVDSLISVKGELHAPAIAQKNGEIMIYAQGANKTDKPGASRVEVAGHLDVSGKNQGENGGTIKVFGDEIAVYSDTVMDASGHTGRANTTANGPVSAVRAGAAGGEILIGGDYLGQGDTPTARVLEVYDDALFLNDATYLGDAGRTIFWSDGKTNFAGLVFARGGRMGGDGGFVETSGKEALQAQGFADLTAAAGHMGTYFLDPTNVTIYGSLSEKDFKKIESGPILDKKKNPTDDSLFTTRYLEDLSTTANVSLKAGNDIILDLNDDTLNFQTFGSSLELTAGNQIKTSSAGTITTTGGAIILNADNGINLSHAYNFNSNSGEITFGNNLTLGAAQTVNSANGAINFNGTVNGNYALTTNSGEKGMTSFLGSLGATTSIGALTVTGPATLYDNITTSSKAVTFNGDVTLANNITVNAKSGALTFNAALDGAYDLISSGTGMTTFTGPIGNAAALRSLSVTGAAMLGSDISTNGDVTLTGAVTLAGNTAITTNSGALTFSSTVNGPYDLTTNSGAGTTTLSGNIGAGTALNTISMTGPVTLGASITTNAKAVTFNNEVTLSSNAVINTNGGALTFSSTIDGGYNLTTNSGAGATKFLKALGATTSIGGLQVTGATTIYDNITTKGAASFNSAITLAGNTAITTKGNALTFASTITGAYNLTTNSGGSMTSFAGNIGGATGIGALTVTGPATVSANIVTNNKDILFNDALTLDNNSSISSKGGAITFASTIDGAYNLTTNSAAGLTTFTKALGATTALGSLTVSGPTILSSSVKTGGQGATFNGAVTLAGNTAITTQGGALTFSSTVDGNYSLTTNSGGGTTKFSKALGATTALAGLDVTGPASLYGNITTQNGAVRFHDALTLAAITSISTQGGALEFDTIDGNYSLTTNSGGGTTKFSKALGATTALGTINVTGPATLANNITTNNKAITFNGALTLTGDASITTKGGALTFAAVDGGHNLTTNSGAGATTFTGDIGALTALTSVSLTSSTSLALPSITAGNIFARASGTSADISIASGKTLTATGSGDAITLSAGRNFINNAGAGALDADNGRWLVYSTKPASDVTGGLENDFRRFSCTFGGACPTLGEGNGFLYTLAPVIKATPNALALTYGDETPDLFGYSYTLSGYLGADAGDDVITGALSGTTNYLQGNNAGSAYNINYATGTLASAMGYVITYANNASAISVAKKDISVSFANPLTRVYGSNNPTLDYNNFTFTGLINSAHNALFTSITPNLGGVTVNSNVGAYNISAALHDTTNYHIAAAPQTTLTITPRMLNVATASRTTTYGDNTPVFSGMNDLTAYDAGLIAWSYAAAHYSGNAGIYTIEANATDTANRLANYTRVNNYGTLTVNKAAVGVSAQNAIYLKGTSVPSLNYNFSGFKYGQTYANSGTNGAPALGFDMKTLSNGTYEMTLNLSGLNAANYTFHEMSENGMLTVMTLRPPSSVAAMSQGSSAQPKMSAGPAPMSTTPPPPAETNDNAETSAPETKSSGKSGSDNGVNVQKTGQPKATALGGMVEVDTSLQHWLGG